MIKAIDYYRGNVYIVCRLYILDQVLRLLIH